MGRGFIFICNSLILFVCNCLIFFNRFLKGQRIHTFNKKHIHRKRIGSEMPPILGSGNMDDYFFFVLFLYF